MNDEKLYDYSHIPYLYLGNSLCIQKLLCCWPEHLLKAWTSINNKHPMQCLYDVWTAIRNKLDSEDENYQLTTTL